MNTQTTKPKALFPLLKTLLGACFLLSTLAPTLAHDETSVLDEIVDRGKIKVGLSSFVPWAMRAKDGELIGFEVDVAVQLAKDLDVELELIPTAWDGIIPSLIAKKFDVIISGMYVTTKRNVQVNFTVPYDTNGLMIVANKSLIDSSYDRIEKFNKTGITIALRRGSYPVQYTKSVLPKTQIVEFDDDGLSRQEVLNGKAHAWIAAEPQPRYSIIDYPDQLHIPVNIQLTQNNQGMAVRKGDYDTLNFLNNWIREKHTNGFLEERHNYWFTTRDWIKLVQN